MSDKKTNGKKTNGDEKPRTKKRPADVIAAEKRAWLAKHEWSGPKRALEIVADAAKELEEAHAACNGKIEEAAAMWGTVQTVLGKLHEAIGAAIPAEAK